MHHLQIIWGYLDICHIICTHLLQTFFQGSFRWVNSLLKSTENLGEHPHMYNFVGVYKISNLPRGQFICTSLPNKHWKNGYTGRFSPLVKCNFHLHGTLESQCSIYKENVMLLIKKTLIQATNDPKHLPNRGTREEAEISHWPSMPVECMIEPRMLLARMPSQRRHQNERVTTTRSPSTQVATTTCLRGRWT